MAYKLSGLTLSRWACVVGTGASLFAAAAPAVGADAAAQYRALPPGEVSCGSWTRGRELGGKGNTVQMTPEGVSRAEREGWVHGYLSALNVESLPAVPGATRDLTEGIDREGLMVLIDNYCTQYPLNSLLAATASVAAVLADRWRAAHPSSVASVPAAAILPAPVAPREAAPLPAPVEIPPPQAAPPPAAPIPPPVAIAQPSPSRATPPTTPAAPSVPPAAPPQPTPAAAAPVAAETPRVASVAGAALLQIGAYRTRAAADEAWGSFRSKYPEIASILTSDIQEVSLGESGIWNRLRVGPFSTDDAASTTCNILKSQGGDCFLVHRE